MQHVKHLSLWRGLWHFKILHCNQYSNKKPRKIDSNDLGANEIKIKCVKKSNWFTQKLCRLCELSCDCFFVSSNAMWLKYNTFEIEYSVCFISKKKKKRNSIYCFDFEVPFIRHLVWYICETVSFWIGIIEEDLPHAFFFCFFLCFLFLFLFYFFSRFFFLTKWMRM